MATPRAVDLNGRPIPRTENWQQGIGIVTYMPDGDGRFFYEAVPIDNGTALFRGTLYRARCDVEGVPLARRDLSNDKGVHDVAPSGGRTDAPGAAPNAVARP